MLAQESLRDSWENKPRDVEDRLDEAERRICSIAQGRENESGGVRSDGAGREAARGVPVPSANPIAAPVPRSPSRRSRTPARPGPAKHGGPPPALH